MYIVTNICMEKAAHTYPAKSSLVHWYSPKFPTSARTAFTSSLTAIPTELAGTLDWHLVSGVRVIASVGHSQLHGVTWPLRNFCLVKSLSLVCRENVWYQRLRELPCHPLLTHSSEITVWPNEPVLLWLQISKCMVWVCTWGHTSLYTWGYRFHHGKIVHIIDHVR